MLIHSRLVKTLLLVLISSFTLAQAPGQTSTMLPDGRALLLGGFNISGEPVSDAFVAAQNGVPQRLQGGLNVARAGHTAAVLPDGTVFIFGGMGTDRQVISRAELFDPATQQFSLLPEVLAVPRAFHTATLLTDGTLLLAGGIEAGGEFPDDVQLWDFRTRRALSYHAVLMTPREGHTAALLADGAVRVSGGTDHFGKRALTDEIYDPLSRRFRFANAAEMAEWQQESGSELRLAASLPVDGAIDVPIGSFIAVRFTQLLNVTTGTGRNFLLAGPDRKPIDARVKAAENGRLVFVMPDAPLQPGTSYTLRIHGAADSAGVEMAETSVRFITEGEPVEPAGANWVPNGTWTAPEGITKFQELPPLQARPGETALSGQVLKLSGWPLEHVTLEMEGKKTHTDPSGRFLLKGLAPGHHVLWIDGSTANRADASYGIYEVSVTILPSKTNVLNYTIWMTRLDTAHAVNIPSPTSSEMVITNPSLPGLELHLPAGTVITDRNGKAVREVSITAIPLNKPPFPLPAGVEVPVYFTIQPGRAYIKVLNPGDGPKGARLFYPNAFHFSPGRAFDFWNYDADVRGWYIYGQGKVSADGNRIVPDPGAVIYEFTGAMVAQAGIAPSTAPPLGNNQQAADPVNLSTGLFVYTKTDLFVPDVLPLSFSRTYRVNDSRSRSFGIGAMDSFDIYLIGDTHPWTYQELVLPDGERVHFDRISIGDSFENAMFLHSGSNTRFYGATILFISPIWILTLRDGTTYQFGENDNSTSQLCGAPNQISDRYGNTILLKRQAGTCLLIQILSPNGRYINVTNDAQNRITQLQDNMGRTVSYTYDPAGRLSTVTDVGNGVTTYAYDDQNRMTTIQDARNIVYLTNQYDSNGRVIQQTEVDTGTYLFNWTLANSGQTWARSAGSISYAGDVGSFRACVSCSEGYSNLVAQVDVTDPRGFVERVQFNGTGMTVTDTRALNQPEQQTATYNYFPDNLLQSVIDLLGRKTSFDYDLNGNMTRVTQLDGTPDAVTATFSYNASFNQVSSVTDPLNHTSTFSYDLSGNLVTATDPLNHSTTFAYNNVGQVTSATDALNHSVQFGYFDGDLVSVTDPLGNVSRQFLDAVGRVIGATDAKGNTVQFQYNNLNLLTQVTDAQGNNTIFSYDPNGNLLSLTDARNHGTSWTYDNMDRVQTRIDPLLRQESYSYDLNGNLVSSTDRKNQVTSLTYDPLNRLKFVGYKTVVNGGVTTYESTTSYTYDAGNRMTQAVDSAGGTITRGYDNLDRLTSETTAQGVITYGYDAASRQTSMTVAGQPAVSYTYDNASRLSQITQGTSSTSFSYDNINRRTSLTLPNNVVVSYGYDNDSRLTGLTYQFGANTLGNLTYTYDDLGRRTQVAGSFARTGLPGTVTSTVYDAANELTNWGGLTIGYDANGNMLSDGSTVFVWNARDEVATLNNISLQYDAFGRRIKNAAGTSFLFNGANAVQELSGTTVTVNLLSGGVDEVFTRTDGSGSFTQLKDALGSTIALADSSGNVQTSYTYDPYGGTSLSGAANANEFQYTGRENEGNGLYFYRNRYYSPGLGRFINEDPLGFGGGDDNLYAYVFDDPINSADPFGTNALPSPGRIAAGARLGWQIIRGVGGNVVTLIAGGSAEGAGAGPVGVIVGIGAAATGGIIYARVKLNSAVADADAAYAASDQAVHQSNLLLMARAQNPAPSLAGRYPAAAGGGGGDDGGCYDDNDIDAAEEQYPNKVGRPDELHHIVPKYLGGPANGYRVLMNAAYHQLITNAFRMRWPYGSPKPTPEQLQQLMNDVYRKYPWKKCK